MNEIEDIYEEAKKLGVEIDYHESDLYIPVTPETRELVRRYKSRANVTMFKNQLTKTKFTYQLWYDIPFAYSPFWDKVSRESERRKLLESPK